MEERNPLGWTGVTLLGSAFGPKKQAGMQAWMLDFQWIFWWCHRWKVSLCFCIRAMLSEKSALLENCQAALLWSPGMALLSDSKHEQRFTEDNSSCSPEPASSNAAASDWAGPRVSPQVASDAYAIRQHNKALVGWPAFRALLKEIYTGCKYQLQHRIHLQMPKWTKINLEVLISNGISLTYKCNIAPVILSERFLIYTLCFLSHWNEELEEQCLILSSFQARSKNSTLHNCRELKFQVKVINHNWILCSLCQVHWGSLLHLHVDF